ncbi:S-methyl-5-thioribose-1-phosphate isomerase [bacterium SCSIO 12741]|nr:S-methyl-5-thioribose-1-phosphate isomerase [bacterium SCSIO 12741]
MILGGKPRRTIGLHPDNPKIVQTFDQRRFPHETVLTDLKSSKDAEYAIKDMWVRGAPLIGATAAFGVYLAGLEALENSDPKAYLEERFAALEATRPTAVNLLWALNEQKKNLQGDLSGEELIAAFRKTAEQIVEDDVAICSNIGEHGLKLIQKIADQKPGEPVRVLTHCNAGWLACIDWGTATAPVYKAQLAGIPIEVWVDETRPRNQGANLTAFELQQQGIPFQVITDNTGGHLMQHGMVDLVIVGTDRTTRDGDVANKIGTYLKALAAFDNHIPFYVALPSTTIDWTIKDGVQEIPIEMRSEDEVHWIHGKRPDGTLDKVRVTPEGSAAANYGFDVTPARLVTGLITERGVCEASEAGLLELFPEQV